MNKIILQLLIVFFIFVSCEKNIIPKDVKLIINNSTNKEELMKFINYFKYNNKDKLKLEAAYFLIRNMEGLKTLDSVSVSGNNVYFDVFHKKALEKGGKLDNDTFYFLIDSINGSLNRNSYFSVTPEYYSDLDHLSSSELIKNHELSFNAWNNFPWSRNVSFEDFCEYILPYRCSETYSLSAKEIFIDKYKWITDSLKNPTDLSLIAKTISDDIDSWFTEDPSLFAEHNYLHYSSFLDRLKGSVGNCEIITETKIAAMRALGIPIGYDFLKWANANSHHFFYKVIDNKNIMSKNLLTNVQDTIDTNNIISGSFYANVPKLNGVPDRVNLYYNRTVSKVYRNTFSKNVSGVNSFIVDLGRIKDVTDQYVQCEDLIYQVPAKYRDEREIVLLTFDNVNWVFQCLERPHKKTKEFHFKNLGRNIVYLPAVIKKGAYTYIDYPFLLNSKGKMIRFSPLPNFEEVILYNKYPFRSIIKIWFSFMKGGLFKVANKKDLSDAKTVFIISSLPFYEKSVKLNLSEKYKYFVYDYSEIDNFRFDVGDIMFYSDQKPITLNTDFSLFGNGGLYGHTIKEAFDSDKLSFFAENKNDKDKFIAIELDKANMVDEIKFSPRNDDNGINQNEAYELFYWDFEWKSLGIRKGDITVKFIDVPRNSLLLLKDTKGGRENRIFSYNNGKQLFW